MTLRSQWLDNEEKLALFCSLIVTGILAALLQQLKEGNDEVGNRGALIEYQELSVPLTRQRVLLEDGPMRSKKLPQRVSVDVNLTPSADTAGLAQAGGGSPADSISPRDPGAQDPAVAQESPVFRYHQDDVVLDSISKTDSTTRLALLRQHLQYSSSTYDTAFALHLIHLSGVIRRFDEQPVTLEDLMQRNLRRYGLPYDPIRPQPLSPQIPLGGALSRLLNYIF